jgi:mono/diheme cytochrome c family protein
MRKLIGTLLTVVVGLLVLGGVALAMAWAGLIPVAATAHHSGAVEEVLEMAFDNAVARSSKDLQPPADVDSPEMQRLGLLHYQDMCATCHGAPGVERSEIGKGLYPHPPLLERHKRASVAKTYWVVKHGVRDTGMPSFGETHSDRELWAMAAFAVAMAHMTPEEYARRLAELGTTAEPTAPIPAGEASAAPHAHAPGAPAAATPHGHR